MNYRYVSQTHQVFIDYAVTGRKESQNMRYKMSLIRFQSFPVLNIFGKVHLKFKSLQFYQVCRSSSLHTLACPRARTSTHTGTCTQARTQLLKLKSPTPFLTSRIPSAHEKTDTSVSNQPFPSISARMAKQEPSDTPSP